MSVDYLPEIIEINVSLSNDSRMFVVVNHVGHSLDSLVSPASTSRIKGTPRSPRFKMFPQNVVLFGQITANILRTLCFVKKVVTKRIRCGPENVAACDVTGQR